MTNAERSNHYSFNLGEVASSALEEMVKKSGHTMSSVVRSALILCWQSGLYLDFEELINKMGDQPKPEPKKKKSTTKKEQMVIDKYREVFSYTGRIFSPAVLGVIRAAVKAGVTEETLAKLVELSPNDALVAQRITRGEHIPLNEILTEKMISRLFPFLDQVVRDETDRQDMYLEGTVKPGAYRKLLDALEPEPFAKAWDLVSQAPSEAEVDRLVGLALENQLDSYLASIAEVIEEGLDHGEES